MRGWVGLLAFVTACGGASQSDVFGEPTPATPGPTTEPSATPTATPTGTGTPKPPDPEPCATTTYYRDQDGDGFGGATTQAACTPPGSDWVTKGGDCADNDEDVFPGQTKYFGDSYSRGGGVKSFDYDCNTKEEQQPPVRKAATVCTFVGNACTGGGFIPSVRSGPGVDSVCGATQVQACTLKLVGPPGVCEPKITSVDPVTCH
jgi:hypothetical protein